MSMARPSPPEPIFNESWGSGSIPQAVSYTVGGDYYQTTVYITTWLEEEMNTHQTGLLWNRYSTGPVPEQVLTLGDTLPTPYTTERGTFAQYGSEKGQSADIGDALTYLITDLDPQKEYRLGFYIYHEESTGVVEKFYADGELLEITSSEAGNETYVEVLIPSELYSQDSSIVISVTKETGPIAVLNEIYVFGTSGFRGGPMSSKISMGLPKVLGMKWISSLPLRGTGKVQLAIPKTTSLTLDLYDVTGRRIKRFFKGTLKAGYHIFSLTPTDDYGRNLPAGVYFLRLQTQEESRVKKIIWMP
jgi:hypothetical protein